ncbi:uncharacterized protein LOC100901611 [Galendromus occidentalis]|uniref:Uncharacterized protein LOC100901611 n=1 Tax=Galendromus occidentalis TaxID=34638 RepID=A0AAJ6QLS9_9ACAR|nr:uncharacterized protein LOC100901611 [Galendromus occidentalis]
MMRTVILLSIVASCTAAIPEGNETGKKVLDAAIDLTAYALRVDRDTMAQVFEILSRNAPDESVMRSAMTSIMKELNEKYSKVLKDIDESIPKEEVDKMKAALSRYGTKC